MKSLVKAVVFKTPNLETSKHFFENSLDFKIRECSAQHFVLSSKGVRIVFIQTDSDFEIELFVDSKIEEILSLNDPNGIHITMKNFSG